MSNDLKLITFLLIILTTVFIFCSCGDIDCEGQRAACLSYDSENNCNVEYGMCIFDKRNANEE